VVCAALIWRKRARTGIHAEELEFVSLEQVDDAWRVALTGAPAPRSLLLA
jgi:hypothetical protein